MIAAAALLAAASFVDCIPEDMTASPVLYRVVGSGRLIVRRAPDCRDASCSEGVYVVPGDELIVYGRVGVRSCALFEATRETIGWVDSDRLAPDLASLHPPASAWVGDWREGDDHIRLARVSDTRLRIAGDAYWPGAHPSPDMPGGPNIGQLDGMAAVSGNRATYDDGEGETGCKATLRLLGRYLVVDDNGNCGGMNVRFGGVYRRRSSAAQAGAIR